MVIELTTPQIRKLVKAHNVLSSIKIPPKSTREQIITLIKNRGYEVDHIGKKLKPKSRPRLREITLNDADRILKKPEKTALQKQKADESKAMKAEVQKKKERELKKEAVKKAMIKKPVVKKPIVKKPIVKKPIVKKPKKKEDDVRPKEKVGKPKFDPNKVQFTIKGQPRLEDKKKGQKVVKQPVKQTVKSSLKDKLIAKDKKAEAEKKQNIKYKKEAKKPYKPSASEGTRKDEILKLIDYFVDDKNKVGKTFKNVKDVNTAIGKLFSSITGPVEDPLANLGTSERKYFIRLMNSMLRYSTKESTGVEVTKKTLQKYEGWYSNTASDDGKQKQKEVAEAPAKLQKKLLKKGSQLEDKPAIRAKEKAEKDKKNKKTENKNKGITKAPDTFDYEETSGYNSKVKSVLKSLYRNANDIINIVNSLEPKKFVEQKQKSDFTDKLSDDFEESTEDLNDDDLNIVEPIYEEVDGDLDNSMSDILTKNRKATGWKPPKPNLKKLQSSYKKSMKEYNDSETEDFEESESYRAAQRQKTLILKHYKESDVPK